MCFFFFHVSPPPLVHVQIYKYKYYIRILYNCPLTNTVVYLYICALGVFCVGCIHVARAAGVERLHARGVDLATQNERRRLNTVVTGWWTAEGVEEDRRGTGKRSARPWCFFRFFFFFSCSGNCVRAAAMHDAAAAAISRRPFSVSCFFLSRLLSSHSFTCIISTRGLGKSSLSISVTYYTDRQTGSEWWFWYACK